MAQFFHSSSNFLVRLSLVLVVAGAGGGLGGLLITAKSPYNTNQGKPVNQPVPFSHKHHVKGLGIDCRHCHFSVEESGFAGIPPTKTCMTCHSQIWTEAPMLEPIRESYRTDESIEWVRVHDLPDYVYFNHSIHIVKGVGCQTCHGQVDEMPLMEKANTLQMDWCMECHWHPEPNLRPMSEITSMTWEPPSDSEERMKLSHELAEEYNVRSKVSCSTCHR
jgi:hypothetical protein